MILDVKSTSMGCSCSLTRFSACFMITIGKHWNMYISSACSAHSNTLGPIQAWAISILYFIMLLRCGRILNRIEARVAETQKQGLGLAMGRAPGCHGALSLGPCYAWKWEKPLIHSSLSCCTAVLRCVCICVCLHWLSNERAFPSVEEGKRKRREVQRETDRQIGRNCLKNVFVYYLCVRL